MANEETPTDKTLAPLDEKTVNPVTDKSNESSDDVIENNIYSKRDSDRLERNQVVRDEIVTSLTAKGIPKNLNEVRVLLTTMENSDTSTHKTAENLARSKASENKGDTQQMVVNMIVEVRNKKATHAKNSEVVKEVSETIMPLDTVDDETSIGVTEFDIKDFTSNARRPDVAK